MWGLVDTDSGDDSSGGYPKAVGFAGVAVAILFFGSNFVPVKKIESGDGMFFQWVMCSAIWWCGLVVQLVRHSPIFYPLAMLGGFIWATGNILTVPIIKTIGLGQGILIWASFNLLIGWASGRFGWFGVTPQLVSDSALNYSGVALCLVSTCIFFFIKSETQTSVEITVTVRSDDDDDPLLPQSVQEEHVTVAPPHTTFLDRMSPVKKRIFGSLACVVAGCLYGVNFQPIFYIMDNYNDEHGNKVSQNVLDYVFAHFCGIYVTSSVYFIIYCAFMRNRPSLYPRIVLPGFISGIMWAVADIGWFIANKSLSEPVAFPMITAGPAVVGALWGVVLFKEIRGRKNLLVLLLATCIALTGVVLTGLSIGGSSSDHNNSTTTNPLTTDSTTTAAGYVLN